MTPDIYVDDVGTLLRYTVVENNAAVDLTGATPKFRFCSPDGDLVFDVTCDQNDLPNGVIGYKTAAGHWKDDAGQWTWQPYVTLAGGEIFFGEPHAINVHSVPDVTP